MSKSGKKPTLENQKISIRDRIRELRRVPARELIPNAKNWRIHPERQQTVMNGILESIGYADALLAYENENGQLVLIDGHLRAQLTPDQTVPVLILDLDENEANTMLALFDPVGALAQKEDSIFIELTNELEGINSNLQAFIDEMKADKKMPKEIDIPDMLQIIVSCSSEDEQRILFTEFKERGLKCRLVDLHSF